jgi:hypothetical protein
MSIAVTTVVQRFRQSLICAELKETKNSGHYKKSLKWHGANWPLENVSPLKVKAFNANSIVRQHYEFCKELRDLNVDVALF